MKKNIALIFALIGWFALIAQYYLHIENRISSLLEANFRFFTYFTILVNLIVTIYFTSVAFKKQGAEDKNIGYLTAITVYITIVGVTYQIILRGTWQPTGLQRIVDELLHSIMPVLTIIFWYLFENKAKVKYSQILKWAVFPIVYLIVILFRGSFSGFYPYPFVDVTALGLTKVLINSLFITILFFIISFLYIRIGKALKK
ncbi:Pr6Pr family membrane protein [Chryseobacterium sp. SIMBA_038]|uniref:Pr6Pr family membrane protein n=1 Tax=Chryseobacterium sp. SIMBA_038 TaxID=3085780 RepID=UPI00397846A2